MLGFGSGVWGVGSWVFGFGFGVWGFRVLAYWVEPGLPEIPLSSFLLLFQGLGVQGLGFRVWGLGFTV